MPTTPTDDLIERLNDPEYAKLYGEENAKVDFAVTLTKARKALDLTQRSLAEKLGVSQPYVAKLECGEANPTLGAIGKLLAAISLRLVTGSAPLKPEPPSPYQAVILVNAADGSDLTLTIDLQYLRRMQEANLFSSYYFYCSTFDFAPGVNAGTAIPMCSTKRESPEALVGSLPGGVTV